MDKIDQQIEESIKLATEKWQAADNAQRCVLIAQDVIDRLNAETLYPAHNWGRVTRVVGGSVQKHLHHPHVVCEACAMGGAMFSMIAFTNNATAEVWGNWDNGLNVLGKDWLTSSHQKLALNAQLHDLFTTKQVQMIELAYEQGCGAMNHWSFADMKTEMDHDQPYEAYVDRYGEYNVHELTTKEAWDCLAFSRQHPNIKNRMKAIMQNIVDNNGTFTPAQSTPTPSSHGQD